LNRINATEPVKRQSSNFVQKSSNLFQNHKTPRTLGFRIEKANPKRIGFNCDLGWREFKLFGGFEETDLIERNF
jgi:hypothetical protein